MNQRLVTFTSIGLIIALVGIIFISRAAQGNSVPRNVSLDTIDLSAQPVLGETDAPVTIIAFEDFTCSHCRHFVEDEFPKIKREFIDTGKANFYFINFAFLGENSRIAGLASECVYQQTAEGFWDYKKVLMRSQGQNIYSTEKLVDLATTYVSGIDAAAMTQCLETEATASNIEKDIALGRAAGVDSTPVIVVNGTFAQNYFYDSVASEIRKALGEEN